MPTQPEFTQDIQIQFVKAGFDLSKTACGHISDFMGPSGAISQNQGDTLHTPRCTSERLQIPNSPPQQNNNISRSKILRDENIRHIYINNAEQNPPKYIGHINPFTMEKILKYLVGDYVSCCKLPSGSLLLEVKTFQQVQRVFDIKTINKIAVVAVLATDINTVKGYVHEPRLLDMSTEELTEKWRNHKVIRVDRPSTQNGSLIITFKDTKLPYRLPMADEWVKVKKYRKKLLQCTKCYKMYHMAKHCTGKVICVNCGKQHSGTCSSTVKGCSNCKVEGHRATDPECPHLKREYDIARLRNQHKVGYQKARDILKKQNRNVSVGNHGHHGNSAGHGGQGTTGHRDHRGHNGGGKDHRNKYKRKTSNLTTAGILNANGPISEPNSSVGGQWTINKSKVNKNFSKNKFGKVVKAKYNTSQATPKSLAPQQKTPSSELKKSYSRALCSGINNSQIASTSSKNVPKICPPKKPYRDMPLIQMDQTITLNNHFDALNNVDDNNVLYNPSPTPQGKKRARPLISDTLSPENLSNAKKNKLDPKQVTVPKVGKRKNLGPKTRIQSDKVIVEKNINPAKGKNISIVETNTEEPLEGVDLDELDNVLRKFVKNASSAGNITYIVKLLETLIKTLTKIEVDGTELSILPSSGPNKQNP